MIDKTAAPLPQAAYQLGQPIRTYKSSEKEVGVAQIVSGFAGMAVFLGILMILGGISESQALLVVLGAVITVVGMIGGIWAWRDQRGNILPSLLVTEQGLVYVGSKKLTALKWDEIDGVSSAVTEFYVMGKHQSNSRFIRLSNTTTRTQISVTNGFPEILAIEEALKAKVMQPIQLQWMQRFQQGNSLNFINDASIEQVVVNQQGIFLKDKAYTWDKIRGVSVEQQTIKTGEQNHQVVSVVVLKYGGEMIVLGELAWFYNYPVFEALVAQNKSG